jgi:hypothetical protein
MKYTALPFVEQLQALPPKDQAAALADVAKKFFASPESQLVAYVLRGVEKEALDGVRGGTAIEMNAGRLAAVEQIRRSLAALLPVSDVADPEPEALEEFVELEPTGFQVPYPHGRMEDSNV